MFDALDLLAWVRSLLHPAPAPIPQYDTPTLLLPRSW